MSGDPTVSQQASSINMSAASRVTASVTSSLASGSGSSTSTSLTTSTSTPTSVLFFLALAVGILIGLLFVFFTARYFVRISYGLHMYPMSSARNAPFPPTTMYAAANFASMRDDTDNYSELSTRNDDDRDSTDSNQLPVLPTPATVSAAAAVPAAASSSNTNNRAGGGNVTVASASVGAGTGTGTGTGAGAGAGAGANVTGDSNEASGSLPQAPSSTPNTPDTTHPAAAHTPTFGNFLNISSTPITAVPVAGARFTSSPDLLERRLLLIHRSGRRYTTIERGRLNTPRGRRRGRRSRYSRMNRLTQAQVDELFPEKTYHDWLNGGKERDMGITDGILEEEDAETGKLPKADKQGKSANARKSTDITANARKSTDITANARRSTDVPANARKSTDVPAKIAEESSSEGVELSNLHPSHSHDTEGTFHSALEPRAEELHFTSGSCAICLELIEEEEVVRGLVCGHVFHAQCLDPWLTRRRACCPMCKRDYFLNNGETSENAESESAPPDEESFSSADCDSIRHDPNMRSVLMDLVSPDERVRLILVDASLLQYRFEERGLQIGHAKYGRFFRVLWWKFMGISKRDLFNWAVLKMYNELDAERLRNFAAENVRTEAATTSTPTTATAAATEAATSTTAAPTTSTTSTAAPTTSTATAPTASTNTVVEQETTHDEPPNGSTNEDTPGETIPQEIAREVVEQRV